MDTIIITFENRDTKFCTDIEVPLDISADDLVTALNVAYHLEMDTPEKRFLRAERPYALIKGNATLRELGLRDASHVYHQKGA